MREWNQPQISGIGESKPTDYKSLATPSLMSRVGIVLASLVMMS
jgi:hypothetical protein